MEADEVKVGKLFDPKQQLRVPSWQRRYSWGRDEWAELWSDIQRIDGEAVRSHFLGSFVLQAWEYSGRAAHSHQYWIVDGQQRLTTLTLLLAAVRDHLAAFMGSASEQNRARDTFTRQLLRTPDVDNDHAARLVLQHEDNRHLADVVEYTSTRDADSTVEKGYRYFFEATSHLTSDELNDLQATVTNSLEGVWVILQNGDNAHRVFQTLNAGGKQLRQSDLVRNYFFLLLGDRAEEFYQSTWFPMESRLGSRIDQFFSAWVTTQGHAGSIRNLFQYFQRDLRDLESDVAAIEAYGSNLARAADHYALIHQPTESLSGALRTVLLDLRRWDPKAAEALLLMLLRQRGDGRLGDAETARAMEIVLSFMARRFMAGYQPNLHRPIFRQVTHRLVAYADQELDVVEGLRYLLSTGDGLNEWPSDQELLDAAENARLYTRPRSRWVALVLERVNRSYFQNQKHVPNELDAKYSVEHIMPQSLSAEWRTDLENWGIEDYTAFHESRQHVLGNLSLSAVNSEQSNKRFFDKRPLLVDDVLRLNKEVAEQPIWGREQIDSRGKLLAGRAASVFERPLTKAERERSSFARLGEGIAEDEEMEVDEES